MYGNLSGFQIGDYVMKTLIGVGGMGEVYEAAHDGNRCAIKIMHEQLAENDGLRERFMREAQLMQALKHPHIVPLLDFGWHGKRLFLAMPFIDNRTLQQVIRTQPFTPRTAWAILNPLTQALEHAHVQGVVHRDLKPGNVLIARQDDHVYLSDFGLGKRPGFDSQLTETGVTLGTPAYMSPEASLGEEVDLRSDIYSIGIILYQLLFSMLPFEGLDDTSMIYAHLYKPVPFPTEPRSDLPSYLKMVILRCLAKDRQDRYPSMRQFISEYVDALDTLREKADQCYAVG